jgi:acyl-CoA thioester hydrolase
MTACLTRPEKFKTLQPSAGSERALSIPAGTYEVRAHMGVLDPAALAAGPITPDLPEPFGIVLRAEESEIDSFGHVNNSAYPRWMEACAWAHSAAVGLDVSRCGVLGRGMALKSLTIDFLRPSFQDQAIVVMNWITQVGRLRAERRFQVCCAETGATLARSHADYVCIDLASGAPARMPPAFVSAYLVLDQVRAKLVGR